MPSGPKKRRAARRNRNKKGDADYQYEEDDFNEPTSTKVEDGLAVKTADRDVELAKEVDPLSSKGDVLVQNVDSKDGLESVPKGEEVKEHVLETSLGEKNDKPVDENVIIESIEAGDRLSGETTAAAAAADDEKMSLPGDVSSRGLLVQDVGFKDVLELGSTENDGKEVEEDVLDSSLEKGDDEKPQAEVLDSAPLVKGPNKRRAARRNKNRKGEMADSQYEEDDLIEPTSIKVEDGLAVKTADPDVELAKEVDALSSKGVILVQNVGSKNVLESVSKGGEVKEHVLDTNLEENNENPVDENVLIESTSKEVADMLDVKTTAADDIDEKMTLPGDDVSSRGFLVQDVGFKDVLESGSMENEGGEGEEDVLDSSLEEDDDEKQPQAEGLESGPDMKGPKKRRASRRNKNRKGEIADSRYEEDDHLEPTSIKVEDGLAVKTADPDVELAKEVDALSSKEVVLVPNVGSIDGLESVSMGKEVKEHVLESSLEENRGKPGDENVIIEPTLVEVSDRLAGETTAAADIDEKMSLPGDVSSRGLLVHDVGFKDVLELGSTENDEKEAAEDVLDSSLEEDDDDEKQPQAKVLDSDPVVKGPKKRRAGRRNKNRKLETADSQFEEDDIIEPTSIKVEDGLAVKTADPGVELAKEVDVLSSKGVVLVQNIGSKDDLESVFKEEEVKQHVLESSLEDNNDKPFDEDFIIESTSNEVTDRLAEETAAAADIDEKIPLPGDVVSSREFLVQDVGFKDVVELGSTENDGKEVAEDVLQSSLKETNDGKQAWTEVLDLGPVRKGPKKRRAAKNKANVSSHNETDSQGTSANVEDGLDVQTAAAADVESGEPVDALSIKRVILVQDVVPKDVFELGLKGNDGEEVHEDVPGPRLENDEFKEPRMEINDSGPKENAEKQVKEVSLIEPSYTKLEDGLDVTTAADVEWADAVDTLSEGDVIVQDVGSEDGFEVGMEGNDEKEVISDVLDLNPEENKGKELPPGKVNDWSPKENDKNVLLEANSTKLDDGLAMKTVDGNTGKLVDEPPSTKEVALDQDVGSEDIFQLDSEKNEGKEVIEDVLDSGLERVEGKEPHLEINDYGLNEDHEKLGDNNAHFESSSIEEAYRLATKTNAASDLEVAEEGNLLSTIGTVLVQGVDFEEALDLGLREYDRKEVTKNFCSSSLEEDDGKQSLKVTETGPALKGRKKRRRAAKKKTSVSSHNQTDFQGEENDFTEPTSINVVDGLVVKSLAATTADVELSEPVDTVSEGDVIAQDFGSEDGFKVGLKGNDEKEAIQEVLDLSLEEDQGKEPPSKANDSGPKENDDNLVEEKIHTEANSTELDDSLAVTTVAADVVLAKQVDELSNKEVALVQDIGFEKFFIKENDGKEVIEDGLDSGLEEVEGREPSMEVHDSDAKDNNENPVEGGVIDPTSVELEDGLVVTTAADVELAELVDPISPKGVVLNRDLGLENLLELSSRENEGKDGDDDAIDSSLEEVDEKESHAEDFGPGSVLKGRKKRRAAKKKTNVHSHNNLDSKVEENAFIKPASIKVEDGLVHNTAADCELGDSGDALSTEGVIYVQDAGPDDVIEIGLKENDGKEVKEDFLDSILEKDEWYETTAELNARGTKENEDKSGEEVSLNEPPYVKLDDGLVITTAANVELAEPDNTLSEWVVVAENVGSEDGIEVGTKGDDKKAVIQNVLDLGQEDDEGKEPHSEVHDSGPKENDDNLVEENVLIEANSTRLDFKQSDGKEDIDDVLDSSLEKVEVKEPPMEVNESGKKENHEKAVEEDALIDPTPIELEDELAVRPMADVELDDPVDAVSSKEVVLIKDLGSEDILELGSKENEGKEVIQDVQLSRGIGSEDVLEMGQKESDGKEEKEDVLNSEQPPMEVFGTDPVLKGTKKRRAAKKKTNVSSQNETDSQGSRKKRAAKKKTNLSSQNETDSQDSNESYDNQVEENVLIRANSTELGFKENDGKEDVEDVLDSSPEKVEIKEPHMEGHDSGPNENHEKAVEEDACIDPTPIGLDDYLKENEGKEVVQDVVSSRGIVLLQDVGSKDVLKLGPKENDGKDVNEDALDSEQPRMEILDSDSILKGPKKRRAAKKKTNVSSQNETDSQALLGPRKRRAAKKKKNISSQNETDSQGPKDDYDTQVEKNVLIEDNSTELEDGLAVRTVASDAELGKPIDEATTKEVSLVRDIGNEDLFRLGLNGNDGKEVIEDVLDSGLEKVEGKEQPMEVNDLGPVEEDAHINPTPFKPEDALATRTADDDGLADPVDAVFSKGNVLDRDVGFEDIMEFGSKKNEGQRVIEDVTDSSSEEDDGKETHEEGLGLGSILKGDNSMDIDEAWVLKIADDLAELAEPADSPPSKGVVHKVGSEDNLESDSKKNTGCDLLEGNELIEEFCDSGLMENEGKEPAEENHELASNVNEAPNLDSGNLVVPPDSIEDHSILSREVELGSKSTEEKELLEGKELAEEHLDSSPKKISREQAAEVLNLEPKENDGVPVVEDPLTDELELASASKETEGKELPSIVAGDSTDSPSVVDSMEDDSVASKEVVQNVIELGSDEKDLLEDTELAVELFDSSPKENDGKPVHDNPLTDELELEPDSLDSNENVDKPEVEDHLTRELELPSDNDTTESVPGGYPLDSAAGVVTPDHMGDDSVILSREAVQNVFELGSVSSDGEDFLDRNKPFEEVLDKSAVKDLLTQEPQMESYSKDSGGKQLASKEVVHIAFSEEPTGEVHDSSPKENDGKRVVEDLQADELELTSDSKEIERKELASAVAADDSVFPKMVVQNALLEGKSGKQNSGVDGDDLMALIKEVRKTIQEQLIVVEDMKVNLRQMLDKVNLIRIAVQG